MQVCLRGEGGCVAVPHSQHFSVCARMHACVQGPFNTLKHYIFIIFILLIKFIYHRNIKERFTTQININKMPTLLGIRKNFSSNIIGNLAAMQACVFFSNISLINAKN